MWSKPNSRVGILAATVLVVLSMGLADCSGRGGINTADLSTVTPRDTLTVTDLFADHSVEPAPVGNANFMAIGKYGPALHHFEGTLSLAKIKLQVALAGTLEVPADIEMRKAFFPSLEIQFFLDGDNLVPTQRGIIFPATGVPWSDTASVDTLNMSEAELGRFWNTQNVHSGSLGVIVGPGKAWSEQTDQGYSRASFPFTLVAWPNSNSRNGIATFLYDNNSVSSLRMQIVQEATPWSMLDMWGQSPMTYRPHEIKDRAFLGTRFAIELTRELPMKTWAELNESRPVLASQVTNIQHQQGRTEGISVAGLVVDDVIYAHPCRARYGDFPYCRQMRHSVYSITKTMGAGLAMLRLAQKYGPDIFDLHISDFLDIQADHDGWENVTFGHALSMATGVGYRGRSGSEGGWNTADEDLGLLRMNATPSQREKLSVAFALGDNYPWGPGEVARYDSMHTFILSAAMDAYLKERQGPESDLWDMVQEEVLDPIGVFHLPMMRTIESDGSPGLPLMYSGLFPTVDDIAKVAKLFSEGGTYNGRQLLHSDKLSEALYRTDIKPGRLTREWGYEYHLSFWLKPSPWWLRNSGCKIWIPMMSGYGGNVVMLLPNGTTAFSLADNWNWDEGLIRAAHDVSRLCPN
jgi:hypothetical protein